MNSNNSAINFSRAGDIFHYRWAAKRCLKLLDFDTNLKYITIEGSSESEKAGECVIDVAEYYESDNHHISVNYYQLKHSTVQLSTPFTLSLLKDTIVGFSKRFLELRLKNNDYGNIKFTIITNRPIAKSFKNNIVKLSKGQDINTTFTKTINKYTDLSGQQLKDFCGLLSFCDGEGNYDAQKHEIHKELMQITCRKDISDITKLLVAKIVEKIEPDKSNIFAIDDILEVFDIKDRYDFFPAPPLFELGSTYIQRAQQNEIITSIQSNFAHTLITAHGGVGKSILCKNLINAFSEDSFVIAYDCFGNGGYRQTSQKRHRVVDAFTQISNQLAKEGLCEKLVPTRHEPDDFWMKAFLSRINQASQKISSYNNEALLVLIFDAVDNAEIAAEEAGDTCFAKLLILEKVPENCRIVYTSRPERVHLFDPPSSINRIELMPFTDQETFLNLRTHYFNASSNDAKEFNRLTSCNPRVQANALSLKFKSVSELLSSFGACCISVEDLIDEQLDKAVLKIKDNFPKDYRTPIDSICTGLATLPPFVPLEVLASVAGVSEDDIKSFIIELGRPLWMTDNSVQFRDEPTEKWFQDSFIASTDQIVKYIERIKPLAEQYSYVSENLPILMLKAKLYDDLVDLALSEKFLPIGRPFDARKVQLFRLQYAFKAALKLRRYLDASKLALRAGEEIAGDNRQTVILSNNCDLTSIFLSKDRIQAVAYRKVIKGAWEGSETVYSASLLSKIEECKGEARSYLRSASHWLKRYIERREENKNSDEYINDKIDINDILELAIAEYNLFGEQKAVDFLLSWSPPSCIYNVSAKFTERLVDSGEFDSILNMAEYGKVNPHYILAVTSRLMDVGRHPSKVCLTRCLNQIIKPGNKLEKPISSSMTGITSGAYLSFLEACVLNQLPKKNILRALNYYIGIPQLHSFIDDHQIFKDRVNFLRYIGIKAALQNNFSIKIDDVLPKNWKSKDSEQYDYSKLNRAKELLGKLLPWYFVTAKILAGIDINITDEHFNAEQISVNSDSYSYREYDPVPYEITRQRFRNIYLYKGYNSIEIDNFLDDFRNSKLKTSINDEINFLRISCRLPILESLIDTFESSCYKNLQVYDVEESPESYSDLFILLSRAILVYNSRAANKYFNMAIDIASNFGDEAVVRWEAIVNIAKKSSEKKNYCDQTAHRFMRCAELIGKRVAREKYWDRNEAVETCFLLSPVSAFAITNRWKERHVGWADRQINALANSAIDSDLLDPSALWSLSAFSWEFGLVDFCGKCIMKEQNKQKQQMIFDYLIKDFRISDVRGEIWLKIQKMAIEYKLKNIELDNIDLLIHQENKIEEDFSNTFSNNEIESDNWSELYDEFDITTKKGLEDALKKFQSLRGYRDSEKFWSGCYKKITSRDADLFLKNICEIEFLNFYDIQIAYEQFPLNWKEKPIIQQYWNESIKCIATRFPYRFINTYENSYIYRSFVHDNITKQLIQQGVIDGFSESVDIESAEALFSFVSYCVSFITTEEAVNLLGFGLKRFELNIDDSFADGPWSSALFPPENIDEAFTQFIYANLGSPVREERWRAMHAVRRLYKLGCKDYIELLIELLTVDKITSFIPLDFPFYSMDSKLFLLTALAICVEDDISLLIDKKEIFVEIALSTTNIHILIQKYAKDIAFKIEEKVIGSFADSVINDLKTVCNSQIAPVLDKRYNFHISTPWHKAKSINTSVKIWFGYDFDRYWFEPLGRVFGVSEKQIIELATEVVFKDWKMSFNNESIDDPRKNLWKKYQNGEGIWHSHGDYPKVDDFTFYISYHAMNAVAAKLIKNMPVVNNQDYEEDSWFDWIKYHFLIGIRTKLIADYRDPFPLQRRDWVFQEKNDNWRQDIRENDFIELLIASWTEDPWLNISGIWNEYENSYNEEMSIFSILLPEHLSDSFLMTISNFDNYLHEHYLQNYCEDDIESEKSVLGFRAISWLDYEESVYGLDSQDPFAGEIDPRPYFVISEIAEKLKLTSDELRKNWYVKDNDQPCIINEIWSEDKPENNEIYNRTGKRAKASLEILICLCEVFNVEIAIQVNIKRELTGTYRRKNNEEGYIPRSSKTFILSKDGRFRDSRKSYQFGQKNC